MGHIVTAGYVTVETQTGPGRAHVDIPCGATLPEDVPAEQVAALLDRGHITSVEDEAVVDPDAVPDGSAAKVLEWVAGDRDRAARALDAEQAKGEQGRKGLLADLSKLIAE